MNQFRNYNKVSTQNQYCSSIICSTYGNNWKSQNLKENVILGQCVMQKSATDTAIICSREKCDQMSLGKTLKPIHHTFMCTDN